LKLVCLKILRQNSKQKITAKVAAHHAIREAWLATRIEPVIDPNQPIIDAHHHLFDRPNQRYLAEDFAADIGVDINVRATVFVQARSFYRTNGPDNFRPIGETEFAANIAEKAIASAGPKLCAAIVGYADLMQGDEVRSVLEAHVAAGKGFFRGIRRILAWDSDERLLNPAYPTTEDMMDNAAFRAGFAQLANLNLSFDAWIFFHQIPKLTALAHRFPNVQIVLNHCGGILGIGSYADRRDDVFKQWRAAMAELSKCPNVTVKIGGLGMALSGFGFEQCAQAPSSETLAKAWQPWVNTCIDLFGANRCMFESNFPVDKGSYSYVIGWNAMMRLSVGLTVAERTAIFLGTASRIYKINGAS
jgi:L-fuconolactonase